MPYKNACRTCSMIISSSFRACLIHPFYRASPSNRAGSPGKRDEVFMWTISARFTGMNFRNLFTCLVTVKVTHGVPGEFSCFDVRNLRKVHFSASKYGIAF